MTATAMDRKKLAMLFGAAAVIEAIRTTSLANAGFWSRFLPPDAFQGAYTTLWWGGLNCVGSFASYLVLVPVLIALKVPARSWGMSLRRRGLSPWLLLLLLAGAVCIGPAAMTLRDVQLYYPVFRYAGHHPALFLGWQGLQLLLYFSTEFFYRGPLLFTLEGAAGKWPAVALMSFPYMMSHFGATAPEIVLSIPAGFLLGWLALRTGSILPGFAVHYCAALSVDVSSLVLRGQLGFLGVHAFMP